MALTANDHFLDAMLRHQIGLLRLSGSIRTEVFALLDATEKDLAQKIIETLKTSGVRSATMKALEITIRGLRGQAWGQVAKLWRKEFRALAASNPQFIANAAQTVMPLTLNFTMPAPALLRALVTSRPFEGRTLSRWASAIAKSDLDRIMGQIRIGLVQGESNQNIARRIVGTRAAGGKNGVTEISRRGALAITRTAVNHFSNQANREFFSENRDVFKTEVYVATLDSRTTLICASLDGERFPVGEGPIPPLHFQCRSVRVGVIDDKIVGQRFAKPTTQRQLLREFTKENKIPRVTDRANLPRGSKGNFDKFSRARTREMIGKVPAQVTYQQWLGRQSVEFQNDVLGVTRGRLFRQGGLELKKFVNRAGDDIPLRDLAKFQSQAFTDAGLDPSNF